MFFRTIKSQLLALSVIPIIVLSLMFAISYTIFQVKLLGEIHLDYGATLVKNIGPSSEFGILTNNEGFLITIAEQIVETSHATSVTIYDSEFKQLIKVGQHGGPPPIDWLKLTQDTETHIHETVDYSSFFAPIYISSTDDIYEDFQDDIFSSTLTDTPIGYIEVTLSKSVLNKELAQVYSVATLGTLVLISIFTIISMILSNRIATPIKRLSTVVGKIEQGDLASRSDIDASGEILDLQNGINSMSETLQHSNETMKKEIHKATRSLQKANNELAKKNIKLALAEKTAVDASNSKSQFLANMSHEIRTPLNGIIGFTDFLKKSGLQSNQREQVDIIASCSLSLLDMINDILDFSKAESGNHQVDKTPLNLNDLIDNIINIVTPSVHNKDLIIGYVIYDDVNPNIISDEQKIRHILTNLFSNAIKFTETGSVELRVSLDENEEGDELLLFSVTDTGIGIDQNQQELIFHPFQQADSSTTRSFGGTGLGLSISKHFAEMLEGTITLESQLKRGSSFHATVAYQPNDQATSKLPPVLLKNTTTLIYSINNLMRFKISHLIRGMGGETEFSSSITDFEEKIQQKNFDFVVISARQHDVNEGTTQQFIDKINQDNPETKVLILLNSLSPELIAKIPKQDSQMVISQPFRQALFHDAIRQLLSPHTQKKDVSTADSTQYETFSLADKRLLLVEDNEINSKLLVALLAQFDITPTLASNGYEAIAACHQRQFDLILMDLHMPNMDGRSATKIIRQTIVDTPIVALTADILVNQNELFNEDGFNDLIIKPISEPKLIDLLKKWLAPDNNSTYQALNKHFKGKEALVQEMYDMLLKDLTEKLPIIKQLWQQRDDHELSEVVHKINGSASYCGVDALQQAASTLEVSLTQGSDDNIDQYYQVFIRIIAQILQEHH